MTLMRFWMFVIVVFIGACSDTAGPRPAFPRGEPPSRPPLSERGSLAPDMGDRDVPRDRCENVAEGFKFVPGESCRYETQTFCVEGDCSVGARAVREIATGECWYFSTCAPPGFADGEAECERYSGGDFCPDALVDCGNLEPEECEGVEKCRLVTATAVLRSASPRCWEPQTREICEEIVEECDEGEPTRKQGASCYLTDTCRPPEVSEHACAPEDAYPACDEWSAGASIVRLEGGHVTQKWELVDTPQNILCGVPAEPLGPPKYLGVDGVTTVPPPGPQKVLLWPFPAGNCAGTSLEIDVTATLATDSVAVTGEAPAELAECADLYLQVRLREAINSAEYTIVARAEEPCGTETLNDLVTIEGGL